MSEFDRSVDVYTKSSWSSCRAIRDGRAEIGFTSLAAAKYIEEWPDVGLQVLSDGGLVPIFFASAIRQEGHRARDVGLVLKWVSDSIEDQLRALDQRVGDRGLSYNVYEMSQRDEGLEFLSSEQLVDEWAYRYDYKSERGRK